MRAIALTYLFHDPNTGLFTSAVSLTEKSANGFIDEPIVQIYPFLTPDEHDE